MASSRHSLVTDRIVNPAIEAEPQPHRGLRFTRITLFALIGLAALALGVAADTRFGIVDMSLDQVARALLSDDGSRERIIIWELRFPRALTGALVGASLAVAGAIMQAVTRNPLASPSLTGVSAGAGLAVVASIVVAPDRPLGLTPIIALAGGLAAGSVVFALANRSLVTPTRLALAGIATATLLLALTTGLLLMNHDTVGTVYFWLAGGVAGRGWQHVELIAPWFLIGAAAALLMARQLDILLLGEDVARSLGVATARIRAALMLVAIFLTGAAVAVAGPIGFVGLIAPHVVRFIVGPSHRALLPLSALFGATLVVWADVASRFVRQPLEIPVGVLIALIGGPFFLALARRNA